MSTFPTKTNKPNILLFLVHDHGKLDIGCYGNSAVRTPTLDKMAAEGMRFDNMYTTTPSCCPSRTALYTGLSGVRNGAWPNHSVSYSTVKGLPVYLQECGYRVGLAGTTHVYPSESFPFEEIPSDIGRWDGGFDLDGLRDFIISAQGEETPFFAVAATGFTHAPFNEEGDFDPEKVKLHPYMVDTPETRQTLARYYHAIEQQDKLLGMAQELLRETGVEQDTIVIYCADHGAQFPHAKWNLYDGGLNVPFVVRWPGVIEGGRTSDALISYVDLLPTFVDLAGGAPPTGLDGKSFRDILEDRADIHNDAVFGVRSMDYPKFIYPMRSVRTERFKYIWNLDPDRQYTSYSADNEPLGVEARKYWIEWVKKAESDTFASERVNAEYYRPSDELYDVQNDPYELDNLAAKPEFADTKAELRRRLEAWMKQQDDQGLETESKAWERLEYWRRTKYAEEFKKDQAIWVGKF
ncbi:MAG TPA: sulfatase atsG [Phycisphaerae bacterium]|nr:sulfatase atsG [Phycisphaerae bacterium]